MTIKDVAEKYDLTQDTLRYYEKVGLIPKVERTQSGNRMYSDQDLRHIEFVKCMRQAGLSIEVLAEYVALNQEGDSTLEKRRQILFDERVRLLKKMAEMQQTLDRLNFKIDNYDRVLKGEKRLTKDDI